LPSSREAPLSATSGQTCALLVTLYLPLCYGDDDVRKLERRAKRSFRPAAAAATHNVWPYRSTFGTGLRNTSLACSHYDNVIKTIITIRYATSRGAYRSTWPSNSWSYLVIYIMHTHQHSAAAAVVFGYATVVFLMFCFVYIFFFFFYNGSIPNFMLLFFYSHIPRNTTIIYNYYSTSRYKLRIIRTVHTLMVLCFRIKRNTWILQNMFVVLRRMEGKTIRYFFLYNNTQTK